MSEGSPPDGPCTLWADADDLSDTVTCGGTAFTDDQTDEALAVASWILWAATGRRYSGGCERTLRPCCGADLVGSVGWAPWRSRWGSSWDVWGDTPWYPTLVDGAWFNVAGCGSPCVAYECGSSIPRLDLGADFPVQEIAEIKIDGDVLDVDAYRLDSYRYAVRVDGDRWPTDQHLVDADTETGTWSVTITAGQDPPVMGRSAAAELAGELLLATCDDGANCRLPQRVVQTQRQGVTYRMTDVLEIVKGGGTGLFAVDLFIGQANPHKIAFAGAVRSPDLHRPARLL